MTEKRRRDGSHAARGAARGGRAFERAHARLEHGDGRVGVAAIDKALFVALETGLGLLGAVIDVARIEKDRLGGLAELASQGAAMDEGGRLVPGNGLVLAVLARAHDRNSLQCGPSNRRNKKPGLWLRQKTGIGSKFASHGLLAICLTWLQAGRPNHHVAEINVLAGPRRQARAIKLAGCLAKFTQKAA